MIRQLRRTWGPLFFCWGILAIPALAAIPPDADLSAELEGWRTAGKMDEFIETNELNLMVSIDWDSGKLTFIRPDHIRWEVKATVDVSWSNDEQGEAERQFDVLLREGFIQNAVMQYFDAEQPAEQQAFNEIKSKAEAILGTGGTPESPNGPGPSLNGPGPCGMCCLPEPMMMEIVVCESHCGRFRRRGCFGWRVCAPVIYSCPMPMVISDCVCGGTLVAGRSAGTSAPTKLAPKATQPSERAVAIRTVPLTQGAIHLVTYQSVVSALAALPAAPVAPGRRSASAGLASGVFGRAFHAYWNGEYESALRYLNLGLGLSTDDARLWYYKGLTELALSRQQDAGDSFAHAVSIHASLTSSEASKVSKSLERIQGGLRQELHLALLFARSGSLPDLPETAVPEQGRVAVR